MDKDLQELVSATRRIGRPRRNQRFPGGAVHRRRGERLLESIRKCGALPQPRIITNKSAEPEPRPDVCTAIAGFGRRLSETIEKASSVRPQQRHFTPVIGSTSTSIQRKSSRRKGDPAENFGNVGPDRYSHKLAIAGVGLICFFAVGVTILTSPSNTRSRAVAKRSLPAHPASQESVPGAPSFQFSQTTIAGEIPIDDVE
jgi:hypothetical protein